LPVDRQGTRVARRGSGTEADGIGRRIGIDRILQRGFRRSAMFAGAGRSPKGGWLVMRQVVVIRSDCQRQIGLVVRGEDSHSASVERWGPDRLAAVGVDRPRICRKAVGNTRRYRTFRKPVAAAMVPEEKWPNHMVVRASSKNAAGRDAAGSDASPWSPAGPGRKDKAWRDTSPFKCGPARTAWWTR